MISFATIDIVALVWFLASWFMYAYFADHTWGDTSNLVKVMHKYRIQWMRQMIKREDRLVDVRIIGHLLQSTTFFASTSILIIIGVFALMNYAERALEIISHIPYAVVTDPYVWVIKTVLLLCIFIFAFFKFTWVLRQFNYATVLIASAPTYQDGDQNMDEARKANKYAMKAATMLSNAARHFNTGIRSYYFGLAALAWYMHPVLLIIAATVVVLVLYRREFLSRTLILLA